MRMLLDCGGKQVDLSRPVVMGILNVTPDSFCDGGQHLRRTDAVQRALDMVAEGAAIIDVGGESTRPGARPVGLQEELDRVIPVIEALAGLPVPISVDTSKPEVMRAAVEAGAGMINDVYALRQDGAPETAASLDVPVCLMHMKGEPRTMQNHPQYGDVVSEVCAFLSERIAACERAGIQRRRLLADPGFGFGKDLRHNLCLLKGLDKLRSLHVPLLVGMSRKRMIGELLNETTVEARLYGSVAAATLAAWFGARIVRVHDVRATVDALKLVSAVQAAK